MGPVNKKYVFLSAVLILLSGWLACEFEMPSTPRLPKRWNSKIIVPLINERYPFADLLYDSTGHAPVYADTTTDTLYYLVEDSLANTITADNDSIFQLRPATASKHIDLSRSIKKDKNGFAKSFQVKLAATLDTTYNHISNARLNSQAGYNLLTLQASLSDTFSNDVQLKLFAANIKDNLNDTLVVDSLTLPAGSLSGSLSRSLAADSLVNPGSAGFIDSLEYQLQVNIQDTLHIDPDSLDQQLRLQMPGMRLGLAAFEGRAYIQGHFDPIQIRHAPLGAQGINFDSTRIAIWLGSATGSFQNLRLYARGESNGQVQAELAVLDTLQAGRYLFDIGEVLARLPQWIYLSLGGGLGQGQYTAGQNFSQQLRGLRYRIYTPMNFTLPAELDLAAAKPTTFFIEDSLTRQKFSRAQNGVIFEAFLTNRTPFQGDIYLMAGNYFLPLLDSATVAQAADFVWNSTADSLFHIDSETTHVHIDTLAVLHVPPATFENGIMQTPGRTTQSYFTAADVISLFADSTYIMPHFKFRNPDTVMTAIRPDHNIQVKGYLHLLFDPEALQPTSEAVADTADSLADTTDGLADTSQVLR